MVRRRFTRDERAAFTQAFTDGAAVEYRNGSHWHPARITGPMVNDDGWQYFPARVEVTTRTISPITPILARPTTLRIPPPVSPPVSLVKTTGPHPLDTKIKLAEQALAGHRSRLASAYNKDEIRRSIAAMAARLKSLRAEREATTAAEQDRPPVSLVKQTAASEPVSLVKTPAPEPVAPRVVFRCPECGLTATTATDPNVWAYGHDCET